MKYVLFAVAAAFVALSNLDSGEQPSGEDGKLRAVFKAFLDEEFKHRPMDATRAGEHRYDHLLDDLSLKARRGDTDRLKKALAALPAGVHYKKLSRPGQI